MPLGHEGAEGDQVAPSQQSLRLAHPGALGDDVARPPAQHGIGERAEVAELAGAEGPAEDVGGPLALGAPRGVGRAREEAGGLAVDDDERRVGWQRRPGASRGWRSRCGGRGRRWRRRSSSGSSRPTWAPAARSASWQSRASASASGSWPRASSSATEKAALEDRPAPTGSVLVTRTVPPDARSLQPQESGRQGGLGGNRGGVTQGDLQRLAGELVRVDPDQEAAGLGREGRPRWRGRWPSAARGRRCSRCGRR